MNQTFIQATLVDGYFESRVFYNPRTVYSLSPRALHSHIFLVESLKMQKKDGWVLKAIRKELQLKLSVEKIKC